MRTVYKYTLASLDDVVSLDMPAGARVLYVAEQYGTICLWALVDTNAPTELRRFRIAGTGHPITMDAGPYIGSVMHRSGSLVFHVFDSGPLPALAGAPHRA